MLYIKEVDDNTFSMKGDVISQDGEKFLPKYGVTAKAKEIAYNEDVARIGIYDSEKGIWLVSGKPLAEITLDGAVHATAESFVKAFNKMVAIP